MNSDFEFGHARISSEDKNWQIIGVFTGDTVQSHGNLELNDVVFICGNQTSTVQLASRRSKMPRSSVPLSPSGRGADGIPDDLCPLEFLKTIHGSRLVNRFMGDLEKIQHLNQKGDMMVLLFGDLEMFWRSR